MMTSADAMRIFSTLATSAKTQLDRARDERLPEADRAEAVARLDAAIAALEEKQ